MADVPAALTRHLTLIEDALRAQLAADRSPLAATARYVMGWEDQDGTPMNTGGKRIRPALCLFAAELFGAPAEAAEPTKVLAA